MRTPEHIQSDILECEIAIAGLQIELAISNDDKTSARQWETKRKGLLSQRSPQQVGRMVDAIERKIAQ